MRIKYKVGVVVVLIILFSIFVLGRADWTRGAGNITYSVVNGSGNCSCSFEDYTGNLSDYFLYLNTSNDPLTAGLRINTTNNDYTHLRLIDNNPSIAFGYGIPNATFTLENRSGHELYKMDEYGYVTWKTRPIKNGVLDYPFTVKIPDTGGLNIYYDVWKLYLRDGGSGVGGRGYETRADYFAPTNDIDTSGGAWMLFYNNYRASYVNWMGVGVTGAREGTHGLFNASFIATSTNGEPNIKPLPLVFLTHGIIAQVIYPNGSIQIRGELPNNRDQLKSGYDVIPLKIFSNSREGFFNTSKLTYWVDNESNDMASFTGDGNFELYDGAFRFVNGSNYVGLTSPGLSDNTTYTLPVSNGSNGMNLYTNASSNTYWGYYPDDVTVCDAGSEGVIIYNSSTKKHYGCNSTHWNNLY